MPVFRVRAALAEEALTRELVDDLAQEVGPVGGEAAAAADDAADHGLGLLVDVQADPVVGADHPSEQVLALVQEQHVAGGGADLRVEEGLDDAGQGVVVEDRVAVDRDDELHVLVEQARRCVMERFSLAGVLLELVQRDRERRGELAQPLLDAVRRPVVDHDHLLQSARHQDGADGLLDELRVLVVAGDDDRDLLAEVRLVAPRLQVVDQQEREQVPRVRDEQHQVAEPEALPEARVRPVAGEEEGGAGADDDEERPIDRRLQPLLHPSAPVGVER